MYLEIIWLDMSNKDMVAKIIKKVEVKQIQLYNKVKSHMLGLIYT